MNSVKRIVGQATNNGDGSYNGVVFVTAGAGDIDAMLQELKKKIEA